MVRIPRLPENRLTTHPAARPAGLRRIAVALPLVAIIGYAAFWFTVAGTVDKQIKAWIDRQRAQGIEITTGDQQTSGFPFRITVQIATPAAHWPGGRWSGPGLTLSGVPWDWRRINWQAPGDHRIEWTGRDGAARSAKLRAQHLEGWGEAGAGNLPRVEAWLTDGELTVPDGSITARGLLLQVSPPTASDDRDAAGTDATGLAPGPRLPISLDAKGVVLPPTYATALGREIDRLALEMSLNGPLTAGPWPQPALRWRDAGGILQISQLGVSHGPLNLTGDGTMAIDGAGQPEGAFTARVTGFAETIEALREQGIVDARSAGAVQIVLGLFAKGPADGPRVLNVPLTLQDRTVSLGPVKLFRLKPVDWFR